jgi:hypothetical protein
MVFKLRSNGFTKECKLKTKGCSIDIKFVVKWVFYGDSIEKNIQEGRHHRANFFFFFLFKHLTEIIAGMFL